MCVCEILHVFIFIRVSAIFTLLFIEKKNQPSRYKSLKIVYRVLSKNYMRKYYHRTKLLSMHSACLHFLIANRNSSFQFSNAYMNIEHNNIIEMEIDEIYIAERCVCYSPAQHIRKTKNTQITNFKDSLMDPS